MLAIDADSHFMEPLDLFERYIDPKFRERAYKVEKDPTTDKHRLVVDNKPLARTAKAIGGLAYTYPEHPTDDAIETYFRPLVSSALRKTQVQEIDDWASRGKGRRIFSKLQNALRKMSVPDRALLLYLAAKMVGKPLKSI